MYERWGKRALDLTGAAFLLALLAPLLGLAALAVLLALGRPVLFRQARAGRGGRPFVLLKFRSMAEGPGEDAARLGRFGRALRASALDELPQLVNVLRGEMSLVGPRPLPAEYLALYTARQARRLRARPGWRRRRGGTRCPGDGASRSTHATRSGRRGSAPTR